MFKKFFQKKEEFKKRIYKFDWKYGREKKITQETYSHMNSVAVDLFFIDLPKEKAIELCWTFGWFFK